MEGITLSRYVEDSLRSRFKQEERNEGSFRLPLTIVRGDRPPSVDISNRDALYNVIDGS